MCFIRTRWGRPSIKWTSNRKGNGHVSDFGESYFSSDDLRFDGSLILPFRRRATQCENCVSLFLFVHKFQSINSKYHRSFTRLPGCPEGNVFHVYVRTYLICK